MRGLSAKLTGGEIHRKSDFSVSPSVKIFDFATSLIRGRQGAFLTERHCSKEGTAFAITYAVLF